MFYNPQISIDRINSQISELEKLKSQIPMQQPITQNFQIAPNSSSIRYANNLEEVQKEFILNDTPFFSKDMAVLWVKSPSGDVKTYELNEIVEKDEKDLRIELLMSQIEELKKEVINNEHITNDDATKNESNSTKNDESNGTTTKKSKSSSV
jgi:hypothetical protein